MTATYHDHASWQIKGEAVLTELIELMQLTDGDRVVLKGLAAQAEACVPELTAAFYARLLAHPNTAEYLEGIPTERLHSMAARWFTDLSRCLPTVFTLPPHFLRASSNESGAM